MTIYMMKKNVMTLSVSVIITTTMTMTKMKNMIMWIFYAHTTEIRSTSISMLPSMMIDLMIQL